MERPEWMPPSGLPWASTSPRVGLSSPTSTRRSVLFPHPLGPRMAMTSLGLTASVTLSSTTFESPAPKATVTSPASQIGDPFSRKALVRAAQRVVWVIWHSDEHAGESNVEAVAGLCQPVHPLPEESV